MTTNEQNKKQPKSKGALICTIILAFFVILGCWGFVSLFSSDSSSNSKNGEVRCSYCAKVIMNDGRPIHCTHDYNSVYICDYCGKSNRIK